MADYKIVATGKPVKGQKEQELSDMFKCLFEEPTMTLKEVGISIVIDTDKDISEEEMSTFTNILEKEAECMEDLIETKITVEKL